MLGNVGLGHFWQNEIKKKRRMKSPKPWVFLGDSFVFLVLIPLILDDFDRVSQAIRMGKL